MFCRQICVVAINALLRGEKFIPKLSMCRKNDKYEVWTWVLLIVNAITITTTIIIVNITTISTIISIIITFWLVVG